MLSIKTYSGINRSIPFFAQKTVPFKGEDVTELLQQGDKALNENRPDEALNIYIQARQKNPEDITIYRKLGRAFLNMNSYKSAQDNYKIYLEKMPEDSETWIDYGDALRKDGLYKNAITAYEKALELDKGNDLAKRNIMEAKNSLLAVYSPEKARREKDMYAAENLKKALKITANYLGPEYMSKIADVQYCFGKTASMGGTGNIAQYENYKKGITVSDTHIYAAPEVIAAYLVHESVHASDKDAYTSVREEQDAYKAAAKFWLKKSNGIKDPEMDYAVSLYKKSPSALSARVEEIYTLRDPDIAKTSPNHPPKKDKINGILSKRKAASQSIRQYDVIA